MKSSQQEQNLENAVRVARERGIVLPTFAQMKDPSRIPQKIREKLKTIGLWELHPLNLFRITWKNEPVEKGGVFGPVNALVIPPAYSGVKATIVMLLGKWFPTGAHKVGAAYGCLAPKIVSGEFDPSRHKAVWPSTGNFCRGGAFDSALMGCTAVAILPEEMSRERFAWLGEIGAEIIATKGCESNVKEIYDECWNIRKNRPDCVIFNQFEEWGNATWHYNVTGPAIEEAVQALTGKHLSAYVSATGSAGTIMAGDYLKSKFSGMTTTAVEALQCPTLLQNGYGAHRIEGIGDKHVPWIHNSRTTDLVTAIDDEQCMRLLRLNNEPAGKAYLRSQGAPEVLVEQLDLLGISGCCNLLAAIKTAKYYELGEDAVVASIATDSLALYQSRLQELTAERGTYTEVQAARDYEFCLHSCTTDHLRELSFHDRKALHNLKYFTWVEQQGRTVEDLNRLWDDPGFIPSQVAQAAEWDQKIEAFNARVGLIL